MRHFCWTDSSGIPSDPNDVHTHVMYLHDEMELIAAKLKVALELDPPVVEGRKRMKEVAQQVLRATFKMINLQTRLGMDASGVPEITLVRVSPAEVYEATNILLAEMVRIKAHLGIQLPRAEHAPSRNKKPRDVFAQVLLLHQEPRRSGKGGRRIRGLGSTPSYSRTDRQVQDGIDPSRTREAFGRGAVFVIIGWRLPSESSLVRALGSRRMEADFSRGMSCTAGPEPERSGDTHRRREPDRLSFAGALGHTVPRCRRCGAPRPRRFRT